MSLFEKCRKQPPHKLTVVEVEYFRPVLTGHRNDPVLGLCRICGAVNCVDWRDAYDHLVATGELMGRPELWNEIGRGEATR